MLGWPTHQRDRIEGAFAETTYNGRGLPIAVQDPSGQSTTRAYSAFGASAPSTEPIVAVDWVREAEVGGVLEVVERATGATRFLHDGPRDARATPSSHATRPPASSTPR